METLDHNAAVFTIVITILLLQRVSELVISKRNEKWLRNQGAIDYGASHYYFIVAVHALFFISVIAEFIYANNIAINWWLIIVAIILQLFRVWILLTLGNYWSTKILVVPNAPLIKTGPYRFVRHPNYVLVALELIVIPMIFNLYITTGIFLLLNSYVLSIRMREEDKALGYR